VQDSQQPFIGLARRVADGIDDHSFMPRSRALAQSGTCVIEARVATPICAANQVFAVGEIGFLVKPPAAKLNRANGLPQLGETRLERKACRWLGVTRRARWWEAPQVCRYNSWVFGAGFHLRGDGIDRPSQEISAAGSTPILFRIGPGGFAAGSDSGS
jgi:hypothetical protein